MAKASEWKAHGAALEYFQRRYGGIPQANFQVSALTGAPGEQCVPADPERVWLIIINNSIGNILLFPNTPAGAGGGITLLANGGVFQVSEELDGAMPIFAYFCTGAAAASLYIGQVRRDLRTGIPETVES